MSTQEKKNVYSCEEKTFFFQFKTMSTLVLTYSSVKLMHTYPYNLAQIGSLYFYIRKPVKKDFSNILNGIINVRAT